MPPGITAIPLPALRRTTMSAIPKEKLARLAARSDAIQAELNHGGVAQAAYVKLTKEFSDLQPIVAAIRELEAVEKEKRDLEALLQDGGADKEMIELAHEELHSIGPKKNQQTD